jgi:thioredoxin 1
MIKHITDATFDEEIRGDIPVAVDFWAPWCGPCKMLGPVLEEVAEELESKVKITKLNVDDNGITAEKYGVFNIPTILIFKNGEVIDKMVGFNPKNAIISWINNHI